MSVPSDRIFQRNLRPRRRPPSLAIGVFSAAVTLLVTSPLSAQRPPALVTVAKVIQKSTAAGQSFVGSVAPIKLATVGSAVDGRVSELTWKVGDRIKQNEPLVQLLTQTIELELAAEKSQLTIYAEELRELENGSRPEEKQQAQANVAAAKARVAAIEARNNYLAGLRQRVEALYKNGRAATEEELEKAVSDMQESNELLREARQQLQAAQATQQLVQIGPRQEKIAQSTARKAMQQAVVDRLEDQLRKYTIISRFDGYVVQKHTELGEWVKRGDPVADVAALDQFHVVANVVDHHIPFAKLGMEVRVEIPAIADQVFTGTIDEIVPQGDVRARTFPVKILVDNVITEDGPLVKSGMFARAMLPTGKVQEVMLVPKDALVLGGPSPVVYVVRGSPEKASVTPVPVQLGVASEGLIEVIGDLEVGATVVVRGNERLRPGQAVRVNNTP